MATMNKKAFVCAGVSKTAVWGQSELILTEGKGCPVMLSSVQLNFYSELASKSATLRLFSLYSFLF